MCSEDFRRRLIEEKYLSKWVSKKDEWKWNSDGTVSVKGNVSIKDNMSKLPVKFKKVTGYFDCGGIGLFTLEGCPDVVGQDFYCYHNNLMSIEHSPKFVGEGYWCYSNSEKFTVSEIKNVCMVKGNIVKE